jgi:DNA-binding Xre family transcriptional regulator
MELQPKLKSLVIDRGYNSLADFSEKTDTSYYLLRRLAHNKANTIDVKFLVDLCKKLDCQVADLLVIKK